MPGQGEGSAAGAGQAALSDALRVSFRLLRWIMIFLVVAYLFSGLFLVSQHEMAVVLVWGKVAGIAEERVKGPGLHWTWPRPFAEVVTIPAERVRTIETDAFWYNEPEMPGVLPPGERPAARAGASLDPLRDGYTLTADANLLHTRWVLRYTVEDPEAYLFRFQHHDALIRHELEHAVVRTSARFPVDRAMRTDIETFQAEVESAVRQRCLGLGLGIRVQGVEIGKPTPPLQVADAFDKVIRAANERGKAILEATSYAVSTRNEAQGERSEILARGQAERERFVSAVTADADFFLKVREQYKRNPRELAQRQMEDTVRRIVAGVEEKYVIPAGEGQVRLQLSPEQENPLEAFE